MFLLVPAYPGSPGPKPLNGCVCVCVFVCVSLVQPPPYGTGGTRPLQLLRSWGSSAFGLIHLSQLAVIFRWAV